MIDASHEIAYNCDRLGSKRRVFYRQQRVTAERARPCFLDSCNGEPFGGDFLVFVNMIVNKISSIRKPVVVLYGNVSIPKAYCQSCRRESFILNGRYACCDRSAVGFVPARFIRESLPEARRKLPPLPERRRILALQGVRCFYCNVPFDSDVFRYGVPIRITIHWDHQLPFAYAQNNKTTNFVAACHVCNGLKGAKLFQTVEEAVEFLALRRKDKGYDW